MFCSVWKSASACERKVLFLFVNYKKEAKTSVWRRAVQRRHWLVCANILPISPTDAFFFSMSSSDEENAKISANTISICLKQIDFFFRETFGDLLLIIITARKFLRLIERSEQLALLLSQTSPIIIFVNVRIVRLHDSILQPSLNYKFSVIARIA